MAEGKGKYLNPKKCKLNDTMMAKVAEQCDLIDKNDMKAAAKLAPEIKALKAQLDTIGGRRNILNVTPDVALKMEMTSNEAIIIVRTAKGVQITKCGLPKSKRVSTDISEIWPEAKKKEVTA